MFRSLILISLLVLTSEVSATEPGNWDFTPGRDVFSEDALLDLSSLNEDVAGQSGFVRRSSDGADFVRGNGVPIRFWAVNTGVAHKGMPALREHARFLAKRGVNMVRFHGQIPQAGKTGGPVTAINRDELARLWQLVAAMKDEGIYTTFSPYFPHAVHRQAAQRWSVPQDSDGLAGLIYFDPVLQDAYKGWLRTALETTNPYTGVALKDEPALAIVQMQNEDSLLFWTLDGLRGREAHLVSDRFGAFLAEKYGSLADAKTALAQHQVPQKIGDIEDDWETGTVALAKTWHLTGGYRAGLTNARLHDQAEFLTTLMRDWHTEVARFLRDDIGARQLLNAGNWKTADDDVLDDLERYAYTTGDVIATNRYVGDLHQGEHPGWAIVEGDLFRQEGVLRRPLDLPIALRQPAGYPYIIPETLWTAPIWQQSEAPLLMSAYQSLTGVDISYWFAAQDVQWRQPKSANGFLPSIGKWVVNTPQLLGSFPAAALIFRQELIAQAPPAVVEHRALNALWAREQPLITTKQGRDPNRDGVLSTVSSATESLTGDGQAISPYSFLAGPVLTVFGSAAPASAHPELGELVDDANRTVTSLTRQLEWNWGEGIVTLNAPHAQGVIGALASQTRSELEDVTITSSAPYASVIVVSMDGAPIVSSGKLLLQIGSLAQPTGWVAEEAEFEDAPALKVQSFGTAPWQINVVEGRVTVTNSKVSRATVLDPNGMPVDQLKITRDGPDLTVEIPTNALYVVLH